MGVSERGWSGYPSRRCGIGGGRDTVETENALRGVSEEDLFYLQQFDSVGYVIARYVIFIEGISWL